MIKFIEIYFVRNVSISIQNTVKTLIGCRNPGGGTTKYDVREMTLAFVFRVLEILRLDLGHISGYHGYYSVIYLSLSSKISKIR